MEQRGNLEEYDVVHEEWLRRTFSVESIKLHYKAVQNDEVYISVQA